MMPLPLDTAKDDLSAKLHKVAGELENQPLFPFLSKTKITKGLYLYGDVGRGKTMVMQKFFNNLAVKHKQMLHYQTLIQFIHKDIHKLQGELTSKIIAKLADKYSKEARVLCIDELEINDIADAMIIGNLLKELIIRKVFIFITGNSKPDELYKDGLQRELFLPFIKMLNENLEVLKIPGEQDYRLLKPADKDTRIFYATDKIADQALSKLITTLGGFDSFAKSRIQVFGRLIEFQTVYNRILLTDFKELLVRELSSSDYVNICQNFELIIVKNIPVFTSRDTDPAIRFIHFIDNAYFYKTVLYMSLATRPEQLCRNDKVAREFQRVSSRIYEMNSISYPKDI